VMSRALKRPLDMLASVEDYEAVTAPMYAWRQAVARDSRTGNALNGIATIDAWRALGGSADGAPGTRSRRRASLIRKLRTAALVRGFPIAVAGLNRAGLGPLRASISGEELRRAGLYAIGEVAARLDLADKHVIFGHTHRAGPLPGDQQSEWRGPGVNGAGSGARFINAGSWTYASVFLGGRPGESPYWPGACVLVEDSGPPVLRHLLADYGHEQLAPRLNRAAG
jgi:hypothetical protein